MSELAERILPSVHSVATLADLRWRDRGRLAAVETEAAVYVGTIGSIIFHTHGQVQVSFKRGESEAKCIASPDTAIAFATDVEVGGRDGR